MLVLIIWLLCAGISAFVAVSKNRSVVEGLALGGLLGVVGLVIEACLPSK